MSTPYSTTYKNKTSRNHRISIKNDVVYLDNKLAPIGYKWFDKGNGATYRVGKDRKFSLTQINGKDVVEKQKPSTYQYNEQAKHSADFYNTKLKDYPDEFTPIDKFNKKLHENVLSRYNTENKYNIPNYLPNVRQIKINSGSRFKGVSVPVNAIDSIVKWTGGNRDKMIKAFGLTGETSFGKHLPLTVVENTGQWGGDYDYNYLNKNPYYNTVEKGEAYYRPSELINNHNYYMTPETKVAGELIRQGKAETTGFEEQSTYLPNGINYVTDIIQHPNDNSISFKYNPQDTAYVNREIRKIPKETFIENPILNGLSYLDSNNYGMGSDYPKLVRDLGLEFLNDKGVKREVNKAVKKYRK